MARVEVPIVVLDNTGAPVAGASVAISHRASGSTATWWDAESGGTASTSPVVTDDNGRVDAWVERGAYNAQISGTGITTYTESFDAAPAADQSIDIAWLSSLILPSGLILPYGGSSSPDTSIWLICDGSPVSRTIYASLFAIVGTAFGAGDGSSTFNLPDLRGRVPVGLGTHASVDTLGETEGVALGSRTPQHNHGTHSHNILASSGATDPADYTRVEAGHSSDSAFFTPQTQPTQVGPSGTPLHGPAYQVVNYLIKV